MKLKSFKSFIKKVKSIYLKEDLKKEIANKIEEFKKYGNSVLIYKDTKLNSNVVKYFMILDPRNYKKCHIFITDNIINITSGDVKDATLNSKTCSVGLSSCNVYNCNCTGSDNFDRELEILECTIKSGEYKDVIVTETVVEGGNYKNCKFEKECVIKKGKFDDKCTFSSDTVKKK